MQKTVRYKYLIVLVAYGIWGVFPVYMHLIENMSAFTVVVHRIVWAFCIMLGILYFNNRLTELVKTVKDVKKLTVITFSGINLGVNWFIFILAIEINRVLDASAGYYIYPALTSFFGMLFLKENFTKIQWVALLVICISIVFYIVSLHTVPFISIFLAISFSLYSISHKLLNVPFDIMFTVETGVMLILLGLYYLFGNRIYFSNIVPSLHDLFFVIGLAALSCLALYAFNAGLKIVRISTISITSYLSPSLQMMFGVLLLNELFNIEKAIFFVFIWLSVFLYLYPIVKSRTSAESRRVKNIDY